MANEFKHKDPCISLTQAEYISACGDGHIFACQATGDILYASSSTVLSKLAKGAANTVLSMGGSCIPAWTASPSVTDLTIGGGCITLTGAATDIDLIDNNASALSFDASGKTGIIDIVTTNCSEGVTMSGTLGVTGVLTATGGIELSHACQNTLTGSGGCLSIQGNVVYRAGGTDVPVADGGTGASTLTDGGVLLGSGTSAVTAMAVLADGEMIVGDGTTDPVAESGATLRTSIGVGTGDSPQFTDLTLTGGCITITNAATDVDLIDNNASALSFDASGKTGIIDIVTTDCSEGVTMSGTLGVTGVLTATGGIELSHATANTLTASSGVLSIEGNVVYSAGGTDVALADGGTGASLSDPGADRILFWDDSAGAIAFLVPNCNLTISGTNLNACGGGSAGGASALQVNDCVAVALGTGSDSKIYYDGTDTHWDLLDTGSGDLVIAQAASHPSPDPGQVHLWAGSAGSVTATTTTQLTIEDNTNTGISILTPASCFGALYFGDPGSNIAGGLIYNHGGPYFCMRVEANNVHRITATSIQAANGCATTPGFAFKCTTGSGILRSTACSMGFSIQTAERMRLDGWELGLGEGAVGDNNGDMTQGLTLGQAGADDLLLALKSSDVAHGQTGAFETDTYGHFKKISAAEGGLAIHGISDATLDTAIFLVGRAGDAVTGSTAGAAAAISIGAVQKCGTGGAGLCGNCDNLFSVRSSNCPQGGAALFVKGDGDIHSKSGGINDSFDAYCDYEVLSGLRGIIASDSCMSFKNSMASFVDKHACLLEQTGVVHLNRDTDGIPFVSHYGMTGLIIDTIRQMHGKISTLETGLKALSEGK